MSILFIIAIISFIQVAYSEKSIFKNPCLTFGTDNRLKDHAQKVFSDLKLSGAFLAEKDGSTLAYGYCGTSHPELGTEVTSETKFNIGSLTKQFTGYLIYELEIERKISPNDPISEYIPEFKEQPIGRITIKQLTGMRSGIPYIFPTSQFLSIQLSNRIYSSDEMLQAIGSLKLEFNPGEKFLYSNLGYSLLGIIIARVEKSTWAETLQKRIFIPFNMNHSTVEGETSGPPAGLAVGLFPLKIFTKNIFIQLPHWNYSMIKGAGGIVTTISDLNLWNQALTQKIKQNSLWSTLLPSGTAANENYSYGWFLTEKSTGTTVVKTISHGGEDPGYCAQNIRVPELNATIIITSNSDYCILNDGAFKPFTQAMLEYLSNRN